MIISSNNSVCQRQLQLQQQQKQQQQHKSNKQLSTLSWSKFSTIQRHTATRTTTTKTRTRIITTTTIQTNCYFNSYTFVFCHLLLLMLALVQPTHCDWLMDCGDCHCKWNSGKKTADCKNLSLAAVPENLSSEVQVLDLSFNRIPYLEQNAFLTAQLLNLHKLFIRNSSLQQIDPRTFTQLEILIELDLSNNLLRSLQANLFVRLVKVRAIVLNGNLLESLGDGIFQNLKYLHKIELKYNRLMRIGTQVFVNVPLLTQIYLDGNRLNFLRKESFESVKRLTALSLDQNPWNCTCELQIFRDFVLKRNLYTPPTACYYPVHLRGMLWVEDQPEAFACKPRIIYPARGASINTSKENVTLVCRVHASPNTLIAWDYNKQMYRAHTPGSGISSGSFNGINGYHQQQQQQQHSLSQQQQQQRVHIQLLRDEQTKEKEFGRDVFISRLTIVGAGKSDEGIYTCLAENAGGKDAVQMSLLVQKPSPRDLLLQGNLIIVICLMALGLLSVSVFLAMVTCCIYKRFKAINPGHHHHHHHHHLDVANQCNAGGVSSTTTTVAGGTDVVLGVGVDDTTEVSNFKHHIQKTNLNGGSGVRSDKYTEVIKHGMTTMDNGSIVGSTSVDGEADSTGISHQQLLLNDANLGHADKAYLERSNEDTLPIKFPHGPAQIEINRIAANNYGNSSSNNSIAGGKQHSNASVFSGIGETSSGRTVEYQPDLLPAYNSKTNCNQKGQLYSPIKATRTINSQEQDRIQQQQQKHQSPKIVTANQEPKSKYNNIVQEYLHSRYGTIANTAANKPGLEKSSKRDAPAIPLTSSASLTAVGYTANATAAESGFTTLQRHTKSVALPSQQRNISVTTTPTDSYEYRQPPPPPPYNAAHRTTGGSILHATRRTSVNEENSENNATKDQGYRDGKTNDATLYATVSTLAATRQTIVTASPSLNFLTTTEYAPRRQLL